MPPSPEQPGRSGVCHCWRAGSCRLAAGASERSWVDSRVVVITVGGELLPRPSVSTVAGQQTKAHWPSMSTTTPDPGDDDPSSSSGRHVALILAEYVRRYVTPL